MRKIAFVTGSRADYGIMRRYLNLLNKDKNIELRIIATGALLCDTYGHQVDLIYNDGFRVDAEISVELNSRSNREVLHTMSETLDKFAEYFEKNVYDLLIILGDRYEMFSVATAAAMQRIPILHIHGGEATYGNYDEFIRHAITKMGLYHFTSTDEYRNRVIQLGETPDRVFYLGALGAENCLYIDEENVLEEVKTLDYKQYFVVLFHPETLTNVSTLDQINALLNSVSEYSNFQYVFLGTNADTNSNVIRDTVKKYVEEHENAVYFENLHTDAYHYLVKNSICLIGNSSSGIIEAPSLGVYTINIGDRQKGRVRGNSIIDIRCKTEDISDAIRNVINTWNVVQPVNPYFKKDSASLYYKTTLELLERMEMDTSNPKVFFDYAKGDR